MCRQAPKQLLGLIRGSTGCAVRAFFQLVLLKQAIQDPQCAFGVLVHNVFGVDGVVEQTLVLQQLQGQGDVVQFKETSLVGKAGMERSGSQGSLPGGGDA